MIRLRQKGWIGVDLGTRAVKIAQVVRRGSRYELAEALVVQRREPWIVDDWLSCAPMASADEIRTGLALGTAFQRRRAACMLPMVLCDLRGLHVPAGSDNERREMIARELESRYGFQRDEREFDFWSTETDAEPRPQGADNVGVFSVAKDWAIQAAEDLGQAGLTVEVLDGLPLAMARAVRMMQRGPTRGPVAALDWGFTRATFCVIVGDRSLFARSLRDCGFGSVVAALGEAFAVTLDEANKLLADEGLPAQSGKWAGRDVQHVIGDVIAENLTRLIDELKRTLSYLKNRHPTLVPSELVLFGGGATINNLTTSLANRIQTKTERWHLNGFLNRKNTATNCPMEMLGPAIALSTLAWMD